MVEQEHSNEQEHRLYRTFGPRARSAKIALQMVIGLAIVIIFLLKLGLEAFYPDAGGILKHFVNNDPLTLVGYALVLSAGVELAYMLYTDEPDEALDPLILGLAAAVLFVLPQLKGGTEGGAVRWELWEIALTILALSVAVGFLFFIRYAYAPTSSGRRPIKGELRSLEKRLERTEAALQAHTASPERQSEEANERGRGTASGPPDRGEVPPAPGVAQEGAQRPLGEEGVREVAMERSRGDGRVAVLGVVIAGVIASIVEPGIYTLGSTVVGATLVFVLVAYADHPDDERKLQSAAYAGALAIALILVFGYLLNWLFFVPTMCRGPLIAQMITPWGDTCFDQRPEERSLNTHHLLFFGVWLVVTLLAYFYRRKLGLPQNRRPRAAEERPGGAQESAQRPWWRRLFGG